MEPNRVMKPYIIEPIVLSVLLFHTPQTGLIVTGVPLTHHKTKVTLTWTETGSTDWLLYVYYTFPVL